MPTLRETFGPIFSTTLGKVGAAAVAGAIAIAGAVLTPLQDVIKDWFWPESIAIDSTVAIFERTPTPLVITLRDNSGGAGMSGGVITVSSPSGGVRLDGPAQISFDPAKGSTTLKPDLKIEAPMFGPEQLKVSVVTNRRKTFGGVINVQVKPLPRVPSARDLSGEYAVILNDTAGFMKLSELTDQAQRFSGEATFENNEAFKLSGYRDGTAFLVKFARGDKPVYRAEGIYCIRKVDDVKWIVVNAKVLRYDVAPTAPPLKLRRTIRDECPGYRTNLKDLDGDGLFYASVLAN